jgi:proton glutamate symport protein
MKKSSMLLQVSLAIILAVIAGSVTGKETAIFGITFYSLFSFLGQLFLNALTLLVVPLVASSIIHGIAGIGKDKSFGRLGGKTFFFYLLTTLLAVLTGLVMVNLIKPGVYEIPHAALTDNVAVASTMMSKVPQNHTQVLGAIFLKLIPINIFEAAASGNMLGVIFFSLLFGFALAKIDSEASHGLVSFWRGIFHTLMRMTHYVMRAMPFGVFCLVAKVFASQGFGMVEYLLMFFLSVISGLLIFMCVILPLLFRFMGLSPLRHFKAMAPALVTAFSTSSSAASLPITMDCVEKRAGVSNRICSFVVPLGTSVNMSGSALYECVAALFIAQFYGIELSFMHQFVIVILSLITSMGVAGIPSASLVAIVIILNAMGFPAEGIALILPVDRILDMCRTTVNVFSDSSCAVLVAHTEGEKVLEARH